MQRRPAIVLMLVLVSLSSVHSDSSPEAAELQLKFSIPAKEGIRPSLSKRFAYSPSGREIITIVRNSGFMIGEPDAIEIRSAEHGSPTPVQW